MGGHVSCLASNEPAANLGPRDDLPPTAASIASNESAASDEPAASIASTAPHNSNNARAVLSTLFPASPRIPEARIASKCSAQAIIERIVKAELHHLTEDVRRDALGNITRISWHWAHLARDDPNGGDAEKSHHVCKICGRCVLRRTGAPGDAWRLCLFCAGYNSETIPEGYEIF